MKIKMSIGPQTPKRKQDIKPIKRAPNNPPPKHTVRKQIRKK